jgi:hypothetical protein
MHQIEVMIPEDRRLVVEVPETIRSGPATLILVTSSAGPLEAEELPSGGAQPSACALLMVQLGPFRLRVDGIE